MHVTLSFLIIPRSPLQLVMGSPQDRGNRIGGGLSKTARSWRLRRRSSRAGVRHLDAVGHDDRLMTTAVARRGLPDDLPEGSAEGPEAGKADIEANVGDT